MSTSNLIETHKLVAIARGIDSDCLPGLVEALVNGGIHCIEVTFDHSSEEGCRKTLDCIQRLDREFGSQVLVGAGTVLTTAEVQQAVDAGARYIISPNVNPDVIRESKRLGAVSIPGALTPTECQLAVDSGADLVKLFPAATLGLAYFKAILAPLKHIRFVPTGGITPENLPDYLRAGAVGAGIGSNLINAAHTRSGRFDLIEQAARAFSQAAALDAEVCR